MKILLKKEKKHNKSNYSRHQLSETANKDEEFDQHVWNEKRKNCLIDQIVDNALSKT